VEGAILNQAALRSMTEERLKDAKALIKGRRWAFAYYTAGYAVECALKSCLLARMIDTGWVFDEVNKKIDDCRTHDFGQLIRIAGMINALNQRLRESAENGDEFSTNWNTVSSWKVTSRYEEKAESEARDLYAAITDKPHGVMKWIRHYW
jgi:HEPN domain-containing protein